MDGGGRQCEEDNTRTKNDDSDGQERDFIQTRRRRKKTSQRGERKQKYETKPHTHNTHKQQLKLPSTSHTAFCFDVVVRCEKETTVNNNGKKAAAASASEHRLSARDILDADYFGVVFLSFST